MHTQHARTNAHGAMRESVRHGVCMYVYTVPYRLTHRTTPLHIIPLQTSIRTYAHTHCTTPYQTSSYTTPLNTPQHTTPFYTPHHTTLYIHTPHSTPHLITHIQHQTTPHHTTPHLIPQHTVIPMHTRN